MWHTARAFAGRYVHAPGVSAPDAEPSTHAFDFDACPKEALRRAGQQALEVVLPLEDERLRRALAASGWRVERRRNARVMTVLGPVTTRSTYLRRAGRPDGLRPMRSRYGITGEQATEGLRRAMTDFGAERAFEGAARALREHYGIAVGGTTVRSVTLREAARIEQEHVDFLGSTPEPSPAGASETVVMGVDGCALRITEGRQREVHHVDGAKVQKERVQLGWIDVRSTFARREGTFDRLCVTAAAQYDGLLDGIRGAARHCGQDVATQLIFVGDGSNPHGGRPARLPHLPVHPRPRAPASAHR